MPYWKSVFRCRASLYIAVSVCLSVCLSQIFHYRSLNLSYPLNRMLMESGRLDLQSLKGVDFRGSWSLLQSVMTFIGIRYIIDHQTSAFLVKTNSCLKLFDLIKYFGGNGLIRKRSRGSLHKNVIFSKFDTVQYSIQMLCSFVLFMPENDFILPHCVYEIRTFLYIYKDFYH